MSDTDEVIISLHASAPRRAFGVGVMILLGVLLIYLAFRGDVQELTVRAFLTVTGLGALYLAQRMRQATVEVIELTDDVLRTSGGEVLAQMDQILRLDRGTFAFKPSNGFIMVLATRQGTRWQPGMWWRVGRRVGVGGVTSAPQAKAMAEIMQAKIAGRDAADG